ncbi:hypothetical protein K2173_015941 [Erythroxylum novogranatense]|uniref:CRM domain-containing protein n=1 Tax=Erythroxylum novogranatense TaxID=1862640 RepID=A0AAV8SF04_9ROSI|nr:hypothetical protein K2173_015941 [Erythroxylum novogranatense]
MAMASSLHASNNSFVFHSLLQLHTHSPNACCTFGTLKFRASCYCCSNGATHATYTTKTKRKPRPSFLQLVQGKWSRKLTSTRKKLPWQEQKQQFQQIEEEEEEEEGEEEEEEDKECLEKKPNSQLDSSHSVTTSFNQSTSAPWIHGAKPRKINSLCRPEKHQLLEQEEEEEYIEKRPNSEVDSSQSVTTSLSQSTSAPWTHGTKTKRTHSLYWPENGERVGRFSDVNEGNVRNVSAVEKTEGALKGVNSNPKVTEKIATLDDNSIELTRDEKISVVKDLSEAVSTKEERQCEDKRLIRNVEVIGYGGQVEARVVKDLTEAVSAKEEEQYEDKGLFRTIDFIGDGSDSNGKIELPWERGSGVASVEEDGRRKTSKTELAEKTLPEHELKRLRNVALRMLERFKVGAAGITQDLVDAIHEKWKLDEVVKLKFEEPFSFNMKRTHEILERRTGGLVIWRSGSSIVLYRGMTYNFQCVQSYTKQSEDNVDVSLHSERIVHDSTRDAGIKLLVNNKYLKNLSEEELMDYSELNNLLDGLGPRFKDWCGPEPLPVDADLLPPIVPGYQPPFRILPYGVRQSLKNKEMTLFRRLARRMPPHFALGRSRDLQGLANSMVKLWETNAIAKIAIKRGVQNTRNERMAEELKILTGGTLLSRNKEYIVFYRGNDFLPPAVREKLRERRQVSYLKHDEEEEARHVASTFIDSTSNTTVGSLVAGTLAETIAANSRWGNQPRREDVEEMMRESASARRASLIKRLENKLAIAKGKVTIAEKSLAKLQQSLQPTELPTDLETLTDEERFLFRKIGLSMKPYLLLGRRELYGGTIENMHLHWKYRELVKIIVKRKSSAQVKHIAISLESESGGVLVSVDRTMKGHAIIVYRGKNYMRPSEMRPKNLLTKRQALARSIELQRREALKHHIVDLQEKIELLKSEQEETIYLDKYSMLDDSSLSDGDDEEQHEAEGTYLEEHDSCNEDAYDQE